MGSPPLAARPLLAALLRDPAASARLLPEADDDDGRPVRARPGLIRRRRARR